MEIIITRINKILQKKKISQVEFAKALGLSESAISRYLSGQRHINIKLLVAIAQYLNVSADYLLGIGEKNEIRTKFNILDSVNIIEIEGGKWVVLPYFLNDDCTITEIIIRYEGIYYRTNLSIYSENDCFWTEQEAIKECERRNGK